MKDVAEVQKDLDKHNLGMAVVQESPVQGLLEKNKDTR